MEESRCIVHVMRLCHAVSQILVDLVDQTLATGDAGLGAGGLGGP